MADRKVQHGCLTAFLTIGIVANAAASLLNLLGGPLARQFPLDTPTWIPPVLYASGVFNIICFVAIFQWYKWGFFGYWVSSIVIFVVNLVLGSSFLQAAIPLVGVVILFIVLQLGGDRKGWSQLE